MSLFFKISYPFFPIFLARHITCGKMLEMDFAIDERKLRPKVQVPEPYHGYARMY